MKRTVLAIAGGIGSGKSTLSDALAGTLGCPRASFGDYVREITRLRGLEDTRENWQAIGASLVETDLERFCAAVLAQASWESGRSLIVDGVRHVEVVDLLRSLVFPSEFRLIYVDADATSRENRLRGRAADAKALAQLELHSTELQVKTALRDRADLIVDVLGTSTILSEMFENGPLVFRDRKPDPLRAFLASPKSRGPQKAAGAVSFTRDVRSDSSNLLLLLPPGFKRLGADGCPYPIASHFSNTLNAPHMTWL